MIKLILLFELASTFIVTAEGGSTVCYEPLGCFPNDGKWQSAVFRPFVPSPDGPDDINTNIRYFNRENKDDEYGIQVYRNLMTYMNKTGFDARRDGTFFITHGFWASGDPRSGGIWAYGNHSAGFWAPWMSEMKDAILTKMDANVFLVDWGNGSARINYFKAASNTRVVGSEIGRFIKHLEKHEQLNPSSVHLIGHSLGAHVSSYAAKLVKGIGRLTGLDAAQPLFEGMTKDVRIDQSDANFVDLIHTNMKPTIPSLGFGMISSVGHVDIYVNGGLEQPGCFTPDGVNIVDLSDLAKVPFSVLVKWISCSHEKSHEYFTASILGNCKIWGRRAGKIGSGINVVTLGHVEPITAAVGKCSSDTCTELGLEAPRYKARGVFAATTIRQYPYCDTSDPSYDRKIIKEIQIYEGEKGPMSSVMKNFDI